MSTIGGMKSSLRSERFGEGIATHNVSDPPFVAAGHGVLTS